MEKALKDKDEAAMLFKEKRFNEAADEYDEAADFVMDMTHDTDPNDEQLVVEPAAKPTYISCKLNAAMCFLKAKDAQNCVRTCTEVLTMWGLNNDDVDSVNQVKALYRRGCANKLLQEWKLAKEDLLAANKIDNKVSFILFVEANNPLLTHSCLEQGRPSRIREHQGRHGGREGEGKIDVRQRF